MNQAGQTNLAGTPKILFEENIAGIADKWRCAVLDLSASGSEISFHIMAA